jgi:hypothetical protein
MTTSLILSRSMLTELDALDERLTGFVRGRTRFSLGADSSPQNSYHPGCGSGCSGSCTGSCSGSCKGDCSGSCGGGCGCSWPR